MITDADGLLRVLNNCLPETGEEAGQGTCGACPYNEDCKDYYQASMPVHWLEDVRAYLKAQMPRLLTLDEIRTLPEGLDVWIDERDGTIRVDTSAATIDDRWFETNLHSAMVADYGVTWRAWTARPTAAQRTAAPWQTEQETEEKP